jgi:hypothetical protein
MSKAETARRRHSLAIKRGERWLTTKHTNDTKEINLFIFTFGFCFAVFALKNNPARRRRS